MRSSNLFMLASMLSAFQYVNAEAADKPTHLCLFEKIFVPCAKLKTPAMAGYYPVRFRPTKWTPLWPNQSIFGGKEPDEQRFKENFYDRAVPFQMGAETAETVELDTKINDERFVDRDLSGTSEWWDKTSRNALRLEDIRNVYRGAEVYGLWRASTNLGMFCMEEMEEAVDGKTLERYCAFSTRYDNLIDYCTFHEDISSGIRGPTGCTTVAESGPKGLRILAARYTAYNYAGGDYAGEFKCEISSSSYKEPERVLSDFLKGYLGESSKYAFSDNYSEVMDVNIRSYQAEGINIFEKNERMFLRLTLHGDFTEAIDNRKRKNKEKPTTTEFSVHYYVTVSAQSTDNITNYREPTKAMTSRIANRFEALLKNEMQSKFSGAQCRFKL